MTLDDSLILGKLLKEKKKWYDRLAYTDGGDVSVEVSGEGEGSNGNSRVNR